MVQYWAAHGLLVLGMAAMPYKDELLEVLRSKRADQIRIVAAEALVRLGGEDEALPYIMENLASSPSVPVRIMAISSLACIGEFARPALSVIRDAKTDDKDYVRNAAIYPEAVLDGTFDPAMPIFKQAMAIKKD